MPTNLPPEAKAKWAQAQQAKDPKVKLELLREFYSSFPKHKSTERLEMSIKRQMIKLEEEVERARKRKTGSSRLEWIVRKEGMVQIAVVGSLYDSVQFFNRLTGKNVNEYEMLLRPITGVFLGANTRFQVVLAPFDEQISSEKREQFLNLARSADGLLILLSSKDPAYTSKLEGWFELHNIEIGNEKLRAEVVQTSTGGIRIVGSSDDVNEREIVKFLSGYKIRNAIVKLSKGATLDDVESAIYERVAKRAIVVASSGETHIPSLIGCDFIIQKEKIDYDGLATSILKKLEKVRIFTKGIGEEPVMKPLIMADPVRVIDVAREIHKDLANYFRYAKLWRQGLPRGIKVGKSFPLNDGDVVEIHSS